MRETRDSGHGADAPRHGAMTCLLVLGAAAAAAVAPGGPRSAGGTMRAGDPIRTGSAAATSSAAGTAFTTTEAADDASAPETRVILIRHAEKGEGEDPPLSLEGEARARTLGHVLEEAGVARIYATQYRRTRQTVAPLADRLGLPVETADAGATVELARRLRAEPAGSVIAVAGHSNTVPALIAALGGPTLRNIPECEYDDLFVITLRSGGATVTHLKYGRPPPPACSSA